MFSNLGLTIEGKISNLKSDGGFRSGFERKADPLKRCVVLMEDPFGANGGLGCGFEKVTCQFQTRCDEPVGNKGLGSEMCRLGPENQLLITYRSNFRLDYNEQASPRSGGEDGDIFV